MRNIILLLALVLSSLSSQAQVVKEYRCDLIADSLRDNAYAVVRQNTTMFTYKNERSGTEKITRIISVLYEKGEPLSYFLEYSDKNRKLTSFSAKLYDAEGRLLKKFNLSHVNKNEFTQSLADDAVNYSFDFSSPTFPFTIHYDYEFSYNNGHLSFPAYMPQDMSNLSVEKSAYTLIVPASVKVQSYKVNGRISAPRITQTKNGQEYLWSINNLKARPDVMYAPVGSDLVPILLLRPETFEYDGTLGNFNNWQEMGKWVKQLIEGRDNLPEDAKAKILEVTKNCTTDRQKVQALYDYLDRTTRYVSIQLGIGGFQPIPAEEVYRTGFGDCKALSNYMKAMLKVVGIASNYSLIRAKADDNGILYSNFPNFNQMNHAILQVPLKGDTLWLECTNAKVPFGYIHDMIAGHEALEISENGGRIVRLRDYHDTLNVIKNSSRIELAADGSATGNSTKLFCVKRYEEADGFPKLSSAEQNGFLRSRIKQIHHIILKDIKWEYHNAELPYLAVNYAFIIENFGNTAGNHQFIPINPFGEKRPLLDKKSRMEDIRIHAGSVNVDSLFIAIPNNFVIESMPYSFTKSSPFGTVSCSIKKREGGIEIVQRVEMNRGDYKASEYLNFNDFLDTINTMSMARIALRKK